MTRRKYKSGTAYCFWRWTDVDSEYITRLHIVKTPAFALCLHWIHKPDPEPFMHDHPVSFLSIILRGSYTELRRKGTSRVQSGEVIRRSFCNFIKASPLDVHSIVAVAPHTVTLCFMGPKTREWGFHTKEGWIGWKAYYARVKSERIEDA